MFETLLELLPGAVPGSVSTTYVDNKNKFQETRQKLSDHLNSQYASLIETLRNRGLAALDYCKLKLKAS